MPTPPFAAAQLVVNAGAPQTGAVLVAAGQTLQLQPQSTVGWQSGGGLWEIYSYPTGWAGPGGTWTFNAITNAWQNTNNTPSSFVAPAIATRWGKFLVRLTVNGGLQNGIALAQLVDTTLAFHTLSQIGFVDVGYLETTQFEAFKQWVGELQANLRLLDTLLAVGSPATPAPLVTTTTNAVTTLFTTPALVASSSMKLVFMVEAMDEADKVKNYWVDDHWVRVGSAAPVRVGTSTGLRDLTGSGAGDADAGFAAAGGLTAAASGNTIVLSCTGANAHTHRWRCVPQVIVGGV